MESKVTNLALVISLTFKLATVSGQEHVNVSSTVGNKVQLPCQADNITDAYEVTWTYEGNGTKLTINKTTVTSDPRVSINNTLASWSLQIDGVQEGDHGPYTCRINANPPVQHRVFLTVFPDANSYSTTTETTPYLDLTGGSTTAYGSCFVSDDCLNEGNCTNNVCQCPANFTGQFCETSLICPPDACNVNNTKSCTVEVEPAPVRYVCNCLPFYKGDVCEVYDYCETYPCQNQGRCSLVRQDSSGEYTCNCYKGGDESQDCLLNDRDDCSLRPPFNSSSFVTCIDKIGKPFAAEMICAPGFKGSTCNIPEPQSQYCKRIAQGCTDEGYCKPLCNHALCNGTRNCDFTVDPYNTTGFRSKTGCKTEFANGYDLQDCRKEDTLFDGFDLLFSKVKDCSPYFNTLCTKDFGNGECRPECNHSDCLWDGYDCFTGSEPEPLPGVVVMELLNDPRVSFQEMERNLSMMMRSRINLTFEDGLNNVITYSMKISHTNFTSVTYVGKYLAAVVGKKPYWLDGLQVTDIFVCAVGSYSAMYSDKCSKQCDTCLQKGEVCDWKNGHCIFGCLPAHWGMTCDPCDTCQEEGEVCNTTTGVCLHGCKAGHWGEKCLPCGSCRQEGEICNNVTGECLYGCINNNFYGAMCKQCDRNCIDGCNSEGTCNNCSSIRFGRTCEKVCDQMCETGTCNRTNGVCFCGTGNFWSQNESRCQLCSNGCRSLCETYTGECTCKAGYYGNQCKEHCHKGCENGTCSVNGTCDVGCRLSYYGDSCSMGCPIGCYTCNRVTGICEGNCKDGFEGQTCEKSSSRSGYVDATTDTTGIVIGVVISLVIIVLILVVACCYWRNRQSGDYVMEDEENEPIKDQPVHTYNNTQMQPTSLAVGHSMDMIELDERPEVAAVYAGPSAEQNLESERLLESADGTSTDKNESGDRADADEGDEGIAPNEEELQDDDIIPSQHTGSNKQHKSSVLIEVGKNGRVLSISSEPEENPNLSHDAGQHPGDDSAFRDSPPQSPLGVAQAPLASEEDLLSGLGPTPFDKSDEPAERENESSDEDDTSQRSRPNSSSSSSSSRKSSSSSSSEPDDKITEM